MSEKCRGMDSATNVPSVNDEIDVSVIVVTYNSADCIKTCLQSALGQEGVVIEAIVVDNVSADETIKTVRGIEGNVRLLVNHENEGFGRACNQGVASCRGKYVMLLNPDAAFDDKYSLAKLCRAMERNSQWGVVGTTVTEADGSVDCPPSLSYPKQERTSRDFSALPGRIAWVFGASMLIKREVFLAVGGFDPEFFLTSEETDLCLRIRERGFEIGFVKEVAVRHMGAASERGKDPYDTWRLRAPGMYRFWAKHYPRKDARNLVRKDWLRARYRESVYRLFSWYAARESPVWQKYRRNKGIGDAAGAFLRVLRKNPELVPTAFPSVHRAVSAK
jgi:N-acetylglucosaminyl-diphospho-decaprenol L-rhamnosyltransferase